MGGDVSDEGSGAVRRWLAGASRAAGLGALFGLGELAAATAASREPLTVVDVVAAASVVLGLTTALGALLGLLLGPVVVGRPGREHVAQGIAAGVLAAVYGLPAAARFDAEGRTFAAVVAVVMAPLAVLVAWAWTRALLRRQAAGTLPALPFLVAALVVVGASVPLLAVLAVRQPAATGAPGDADLLLVTVDGLRADDVADVPALAALAARSVRFSEAVAPGGGSLAGAASVLTGVHPLRHHAVDDDARLREGLGTLFDTLGAQGWRTGAFVSSVVMGAHSGLGRGFQVVDDALGGPRVVAGAALAGWFVADRLPVRRQGVETVAAWAAWRGDGGPAAAWVHLADPLVSTASRDDGLRALDAAVEAIRAAVASRPTVLIVVGSRGALRGEHGRGPGSGEPWEEVVRVPLLVAAPGVVPWEVPHAVRTWDVAPTALDLLRLTPEIGEGVTLRPFLEGTAERGMSATLWGRDVDGAALVGLRTEEVKVIAEVEGDVERLYDLVADPEEAHDIAADQPAALETAREALAGERATAAALRPLRASAAVHRRIAAFHATVGDR